MKNKNINKKPPPDICNIDFSYLNFPVLTSSVIEVLCKDIPDKAKPWINR